MPVKDRNPFGTAVVEGKADEGVEDPFTTTATSVVVCPVCGEKDPNKISTMNIGRWVHRACGTCKNKWQGGGAIAMKVDDPPPPGDADLEIPPDVRLGGLWSDD